MLLSFNWLKKHLVLPASATPQEVAQKLTLSTVEVENISDLGADLHGIVVGRITAVEKHPNADRLRVCTVDIGSEKLSIVCGGSNVAENMLVAVGKIGAKVRWHGEGEPIVLEPATIRGVASAGMICGADEIGLIDRFPKHNEKEIVDLTAFGYAPGTPLANALGLDDVIFEIDNKALSNRPDLWGHYGIAREIAALYETDLQPYETKPTGRSKGKALTTNIQTEGCTRYMSAKLTSITVAESPAWLKAALLSIGIRPINNIVDATNYVMLDLGQPLHAFDTAAINDNIINVRSALAGETIELLDGKTYTLGEHHLVIATPGAILGLAGIMGGKTSSIQPSTTTIALESATFDPSIIRSGASKLGLRTDASMRFEKSLDPELCPTALAKVIELIKELCPNAELVGSPTDAYPHPAEKRVIEAPREFFTTLLGTPVPEAIAEGILTRLGFKVSIKKTTLRATVPSWRATKDINLPEDLAEEIARIYGYDTIPAVLPHIALSPITPAPLAALKRICEDALAYTVGASETPSYSFVSKQQIETLGDDPARYLELANPLSAEKPYLRRSLVPNLLEATRFNCAHATSVRLFEIGKVFHGETAGELEQPESTERLPLQDTYLALIITEIDNKQPFFEVKRSLEILAHATSHKLRLSTASSVPPHHHPFRSAEILSNTTVVGTLYELHPIVAERCGLAWRTAILELNLSILSSQAISDRRITQPNAFPTAERDIALVMKKEKAYELIAETISNCSPLVTNISLIDHYEGAHVPNDSKSLTLRLNFVAPDRTLTTEEIDNALRRISELLGELHGTTTR